MDSNGAESRSCVIGRFWCHIFSYYSYSRGKKPCSVGPLRGMARPRIADGGDGFNVWRVTTNVLNNQSQTVDKRWSSSLDVEPGANNSSP